MLKNIITSGITALIVVLLAVGLVGGNPKTATLGGFTNYDSLGLTSQLTVGSSSPATAAELIAQSTGTTTLVLNSTGTAKPSCIQGKNVTGDTFTAWIGASNTWVIATSSTASCK